MISKHPLPPMITTRIPCLLLAAFGLSSCDKIKEITDGMTSKVSDKLEERLEDPVEEPVHNPLMDLVDQTEEGVVFRKDLRFPSELKVVTVAKRKVNGRVFHESELGRKVDAVNGKEEITAVFERKGSTVLYTIKDTSFSIPTPATEEGGEPGSSAVENPFRHAPPPKKTMTFVQQGGAWKGKGGGDFKLMAMSQQLSPVFGDLIMDNALLPRSLWFSTSRIKIGDEIEVSQAVMPMIITGKTKGSMKIKFEEIEEIEGHPCGRFSVKGEYKRTGFPNLEGHLIDQEVTVESGDIWLSLIYPIILKEKLKTIQTFSPSDGGSVVGRAQGTVDTLLVRQWENLEPLPEPEPKLEPESEPASQSDDEAGQDEVATEPSPAPES